MEYPPVPIFIFFSLTSVERRSARPFVSTGILFKRSVSLDKDKGFVLWLKYVRILTSRSLEPEGVVDRGVRVALAVANPVRLRDEVI